MNRKIGHLAAHMFLVAILLFGNVWLYSLFQKFSQMQAQMEGFGKNVIDKVLLNKEDFGQERIIQSIKLLSDRGGEISAVKQIVFITMLIFSISMIYLVFDLYKKSKNRL